MSSLKWTSSNLACVCVCVCVCVCAYVYVWIFDSIGIVKILERSTLKELSTKQIKARNMNKGIFNTYVTHSCITFHTKSAAAATITIGNSSISTTSEDLEKDKSNTVNPKGNQPWIFIGRAEAEAEAPILWPPDVKTPLTGKDWRLEEKGTTEDEMLGGHHWLNGHEFEQTLGGGEGQGSLACCSPWCHKKLDTTERLNNNKMHILIILTQTHSRWPKRAS